MQIQNLVSMRTWVTARCDEDCLVPSGVGGDRGPSCMPWHELLLPPQRPLTQGSPQHLPPLSLQWFSFLFSSTMNTQRTGHNSDASKKRPPTLPQIPPIRFHFKFSYRQHAGAVSPSEFVRNPSPYISHPTITYAFFGDCTRNLSTTSSARLAVRLQSFRDRLAAQLQFFHVGRVLGTSVNKMVEPSHQVLINIVETDGIMRAALASEFEVDRVEGVPSMESWQKLIFQGVGQTEPAAAMMDCHPEERISHPRVGARSG